MADLDFNHYRKGGWLQEATPKATSKADGGALTAKQRKHLPKKDFALPGGRYPVNDENHARNALARVSQFGTSAEKSKVRAAVRRKYPDIAHGE